MHSIPSPEPPKSTIEYTYSCIAFIDILGQKEAFQEKGRYIDTIDQNLENYEVLLSKMKRAHAETYASVEILRDQFKHFIDAYTRCGSPPANIPKDKIEMFNAMNKTSIDLQFFSDCILAHSTLKPEGYYANVINSVYGILMACGALLFLSLTIKKPFRAGIDVGFGIKSNNEIYGPALFRAYELEANVCQYPRIVIGEQLLNFLGNLSHRNPQFDNQAKEDIEWCKILADKCLSYICIDLDGVPALDYLNKEFVASVKEELGDDKIKEMYSQARTFIEVEYERQKQLSQKLAHRYYLLRQYFISREKDFI